MARWRLIEPHYIHARPTDIDIVEWEYKEQDRITGREKRKRFPVPMYIDKETIVCREESVVNPATDIIYEGPPTMSMEPLDEEAETISAQYRAGWVNPMDAAFLQNPAAVTPEEVLTRLEGLLTKAMGNQVAVPTKAVTREEFEALNKKLEILMKRNAELEARA